MARVVMLVLFLVAGCAKAAPPSSCPLPPKPEESLSSRKESCNDLFLHVADLGVRAYVVEEGSHPSRKEFETLKAEWCEQLKENGKAAKLEYMCLSQMTSDQITCANKAQSLEQINGCFE